MDKKKSDKRKEKKKKEKAEEAKAFESSVTDAAAPVPRVDKMTNGGALGVGFTQEMDFSTEELSWIKNMKGGSRRILQTSTLLQILSDGIDFSWGVKEVTNSGIEFDMKFNDPLEISQGDEPDEIALMLSLS